MRTNIVIDEALLEEARRYTSARTKRAIVHEALRTFVDLKARERAGRDYASRLATLRGELGRLSLRESPMAVLRADRDRR